MRLQAPIGVFDSGVGGLSVLRSLRMVLPREDFVYFADSSYAPYGERDVAHVLARSTAVADQLIGQQGCKALVVACNTATAAAIVAIRSRHASTPVIGIEPALKPAARLTRTGRIGVMATRSTLNSARFQQLQSDHSQHVVFVCQPCDGLANAVEELATSRDASKMIALCERYISAMGPFGVQPGEMDTLVLGCTHYAFAAGCLRTLIGPQISILEPGNAVAQRTRTLLEARGLIHPADRDGLLTLQSSGDVSPLERAASHWLR